jgi:hypothetical protein
VVHTAAANEYIAAARAASWATAIIAPPPSVPP